MAAVQKAKNITTDDGGFDDVDALAALAQSSFHAAKRKAIAENDRLGVASYGAVDGKITVRQPPLVKTPAGPT